MYEQLQPYKTAAVNCSIYYLSLLSVNLYAGVYPL